MPLTSLSIFNAADPSSVAVTTACASLFFCLSPGTVLAIETNVTGYATCLVADLDVSTSQSFNAFGLVSTQALSLIEAALVNPGFDVGKPAVIIQTRDYSNGSCSAQGWTFQLLTTDGGVPVAASPAFVSGTSFVQPDAGVATNSSGVELLFNIDPTATDVRYVGIPPDAGPGAPACHWLGGSTFQYTGTARLKGGVFTIIPYPIGT